MKCREFEKRIYLYEELASSDRILMDDHINQCAACSQLANQIFLSLAMIKKVSTHIQEPTNPDQITQRIMNAIEQGKRVSFLSELTTYLDNLFVRYAISALSVFLISYFIYEQQAIDHSLTVSSISKTGQTQGAVLDMSKFHNTYMKRRENRPPESLNSRHSYYKSERVEKNI